jgi:hypothetical protein
MVRGANGMLGSSALQDNSWPYWWVVPRANTQYVQRVGSIVAPPNATITEVCRVEVPAGFCFILRGIFHSFTTGIGGAPVFVDGSGDIQWTIDVDQDVGAIALSGYGLPDLTNMAYQRGSVIAPWPIEGYTVFDPYQIIRYKVATTAAIAPGVPNYITAGLFGWFDKAL